MPAVNDSQGLRGFCSKRAFRTYTPAAIVESMLAWAADQGEPAVVVDPGTGSARFLLAAGHLFPNTSLVGIEIDPLAALVARANLAQAGFAARSKVLLGDFRSLDLADMLRGEPTLFIGNPPYVRHHLIEPRWKQWLVRSGRKLGLDVSGLAGLHVHFFVATALRMNRGDRGCFITSSEWLDVNYGRMVRQLFLSKLGGTRLVHIEPTAELFPDAATTGVITCFEAEARAKSIFVQRVERVADLNRLSGKRRVRRERFENENRWTHLTRRNSPAPEGYIELGELCRVHRGQVTGANDVWILDAARFDLPDSVLYPTVTRAKELFSADGELRDNAKLRRVIDLPANLDELNGSVRDRVDGFLRFAKAQGADQGYVARNRRAWWSVGLREPAPILATYMARRPPAFVRNSAKARHLNIAHGLYPREAFSARVLRSLVRFLSSAVSTAAGRTYAGGLTKFEPREMERILVPEPMLLDAGSFA
jgi:adenine-specific DNA-methyltransferase